MYNHILTSQSLGYQWLNQLAQKEGVESYNPSGHHSISLVHDQMTQMWHMFCKVDLNKFYGSNHTRWVTRMEHYFSLLGIIYDLMKLRVGVLYLDPECWQWWQWNKKSHMGCIA
jgi:hypothetical protein